MTRSGSTRFPVGKLPVATLERLLERNKISDRRVIVGPGIGEDAAVIDAGGSRYLIAKTDPITFTGRRSFGAVWKVISDGWLVLPGGPLRRMDAGR